MTELRDAAGDVAAATRSAGRDVARHALPVRTADDPIDALERDLHRRVDGEVRFDAASRGAYARDASNYRTPPIGVVVPRTTDAVVEAVAVCRAHGAPILGRGGGTSLAGQCCNAGVVLDFSPHLHRIVDLDPDARTVTVQPGLVLDDLRRAVAPHDLTFGPDPATHSRCTIGGMLGNDSCGVHSVLAGRTVDNVVGMEVVTYDGVRLRVGPTTEHQLAEIVAGGGRRGEIYEGLRDLRDRYADEIRARFPDIPRRVSGYNLDELLPEHGFDVARALVGTESTCVLVLEATLRLVPWPRHRTLVVLGYPDVCAAADDVPRILEHDPIGLEGLDAELIDDERAKGMHPDALSQLPEGRGYLLVELGADLEGRAEERARALVDAVGGEGGPDAAVFDDPRQEAKIWEIRESGLGATARAPGRPDTWPGWEDAAVAPDRLGDYLRQFEALLADFGYHGAVYGHFGDGCVHTRIDFDLRSEAGVARYRAFVERAAELVVAHGGSLSGEHGDGQARAELLPTMFGDELVAAFAAFKDLWDPDGGMNPGKVVRPRRLDDDLALGPDDHPARPATHFGYPDDDGTFVRAARRCVGVGKCRKTGAGTMCPSYMVTRDEVHSTRGRARLLDEMLRGEVVADGWRSRAVRDALDLCLACKSCKSECPLGVDMATYKAEFLAHHYAHRLRPLAHYSMGLLPLWARAATKAPGLVNALTQTPGLRAVAKRAGGIEPRRDLPRFARTSLHDWFAARPRPPSRGDGPEVLLWPDTFTNYLQPAVGRAAVEVLEAAGCTVTLPDRPLCCGLTRITTGMLPSAKRTLRRTLDALAPQLDAGTPIVGLEPSCTAVFRSDAAELLAGDPDAARLAEVTVTLGELLAGRLDAGWEPARLERPALVQGHCHHKAIMGTDADRRVLAAAGVDAEELDAGCCGLAGSFGFERGHHDVSVGAGERVLLPSVRAASPETVLVADGFSCRTQIEQCTDRRALHLAQVLRVAMAAGPPPHPDDAFDIEPDPPAWG